LPHAYLLLVLQKHATAGACCYLAVLRQLLCAEYHLIVL
jgi:hypothetical protein